MTEPSAPVTEEGRSVGARLAAAREAKGLSVADVAERLKFSPKQVRALEASDFGALPGTTFVRGMIRGYAKLLDIDAQPLLAEVGSTLRPAESVVPLASEGVPFTQGTRRGVSIYVVLSITILVGIGLVLADWILRARESARMAAIPPAAPAAEPARPPAPLESTVVAAVSVDAPPEPKSDGGMAAPVSTDVATGGLASAAVSEASPAAGPMPAEAEAANRIRLEFEGESWVEIKDAEGRTIFSQLNRPGSERVVEGSPPFSIVIGNASGVRVLYNDEPVDLAPYTRTDVARLTLN